VQQIRIRRPRVRREHPWHEVLPPDPGSRAVSVVQHLASLPVWERKARRVTVEPAGPRNGS